MVWILQEELAHVAMRILHEELDRVLKVAHVHKGLMKDVVEL